MVDNSRFAVEKTVKRESLTVGAGPDPPCDTFVAVSQGRDGLLLLVCVGRIKVVLGGGIPETEERDGLGRVSACLRVRSTATLRR